MRGFDKYFIILARHQASFFYRVYLLSTHENNDTHSAVILSNDFEVEKTFPAPGFEPMSIQFEAKKLLPLSCQLVFFAH